MAEPEHKSSPSLLNSLGDKSLGVLWEPSLELIKTQRFLSTEGLCHKQPPWIISSTHLQPLILLGAGGCSAEACQVSAGPHGPWHLCQICQWLVVLGLMFACPVPPSGSELRADLVLWSPERWLCCRGCGVYVGWALLFLQLWTETSPCCPSFFSSKIGLLICTSISFYI